MSLVYTAVTSLYGDVTSFCGDVTSLCGDIIIVYIYIYICIYNEVTCVAVFLQSNESRTQ